MLQQLPYMVGHAIVILIAFGIFSLVVKHNRENSTQKPLPGELIIGSALLGLLGMAGFAVIYVIRYQIYRWRKLGKSTAKTPFTLDFPAKSNEVLPAESPEISTEL